MDEAARFEAERGEELRKLQRDRRVLEKQSRAILKMPTKQSKEEVAAVEVRWQLPPVANPHPEAHHRCRQHLCLPGRLAPPPLAADQPCRPTLPASLPRLAALCLPQALLAEERRSGRAREARHKLTVERLRQQLVELQDKNGELREQVQYLERQQLQQSWGGTAGDADAGGPRAADRSSTSAAASYGGAAVTAVSPAAAGRPAAAPAGCSGQPGAAGRAQRGRGQLPVVRVERGCTPVAPAGPPTASAMMAGAAGGFAGSRHLQTHGPAGQVETHGQVQWGAGGEGEEEGQEEEEDGQYIADVQLSEEEVIVYEAEQEQGQGQGQAAETHSQLAGAAAVMTKASSAVARFNQLRDSLAQQEGLQSRLGSRLASLQASPHLAATRLAADSKPGVSPALSATSAAADGHAGTGSFQAAGHASGEDDLRRLGRTLLAAAASHPQPAGPADPPAAQQAAAPVHLSAPPGAAAPAPGSAGDAVVSESQHPDGRCERLYASGLREQRFANGSTRLTVPGAACLTRFANGDVKKVLPCGTVEYWYAEVSSWQVTHPSGVDVFYFASGQVGGGAGLLLG